MTRKTKERLQKVLAQDGVGSRRQCEKLISEGHISVNGTVIKEMGFKVTAEDKIAVDGIPVSAQEKVYFLFNKPARCLCTMSDDRGRPTVADYFNDAGVRVFPVGRLDYETTGLLLMTNDGAFAQAMMRPSSGIRKTYEVSVDGVLTDTMCRMLERGIMLKDGKTRPAEVFIVKRSEKKNRTMLEITICEGRNREVRRMMEYFHCRVTRLHRSRYAFLDSAHLRQGEYRKLRMYEVKKLMGLASHGSSTPEETSKSSSGSM